MSTNVNRNDDDDRDGPSRDGVVRQFRSACERESGEGLSALLAPSARIVVDRGIHSSAGAQPSGAEAAPWVILGALSPLATSVLAERSVNGSTAIVQLREGRVVAVVTLEIAATAQLTGAVEAVWISANPEKLARWN
jgi:hypothetical protein